MILRGRVCHDLHLSLLPGKDLDSLRHRLSRLNSARILLDLESYDSLDPSRSATSTSSEATAEARAGSEWSRLRVGPGSRTEVEVKIRREFEDFESSTYEVSLGAKVDNSPNVQSSSSFSGR